MAKIKQASAGRRKGITESVLRLLLLLLRACTYTHAGMPRSQKKRGEKAARGMRARRERKERKEEIYERRVRNELEEWYEGFSESGKICVIFKVKICLQNTIFIVGVCKIIYLLASFNKNDFVSVKQEACKYGIFQKHDK